MTKGMTSIVTEGVTKLRGCKKGKTTEGDPFSCPQVSSQEDATYQMD